MDGIVQKTGATAVVEGGPSVTIDVKESSDYDMAALKDRFNEITKNAMESSKENIAVIQSAIAKVLGPNKKVADLIPGQEELLVEIIGNLENEFGI